MHCLNSFVARAVGLRLVTGIMPRPKPHYSMHLRNHETGDQLKLELVNLPFASTRTFRARVNGQWARKVPIASTTAVLRQLRYVVGDSLTAESGEKSSPPRDFSELCRAIPVGKRVTDNWSPRLR